MKDKHPIWTKLDWRGARPLTLRWSKKLFLKIRGKFMVIRVLIREEFWPVASGFLEMEVLKALFRIFKIHKNIDFFGINSIKIIIFLEFVRKFPS